eukprot:5428815-Pyramimonas_sp.AAC.2
MMLIHVQGLSWNDCLFGKRSSGLSRTDPRQLSKRKASDQIRSNIAGRHLCRRHTGLKAAAEVHQLYSTDLIPLEIPRRTSQPEV